ncbi:MAG: hypothetical protein ACYDHZ_07835 [Dehalococcoidia bacterium]|jgi:hypothetical protein
MNPRYFTSILAVTIFMLSLVSVSCNAGHISYDPAKTYAAAIAIDLPSARAAMDDIRQKSAADGFELGPVEYYQLGETNFEPLITKITSQAHVGLLWIAGGLEDVREIQAAVAKAGYSGQTRLMPISGPAPYQP